MLNCCALGRHAAARVHATQRAAFSTSAPAAIDISSLYSKLTSFRRKAPKPQVVDPTKVESSKTSDDSLSQDSRPRKLTVLGRPRSLEADWPRVRKFAEFTPWPTNHYRKDLSAQQIDDALAGIQDSALAEISSRFEAVKAVSRALNVAIPDSVLTTVSSVQGLRSYLLTVARPFDERQPDAIYLDPKVFEGTNIIISDPVAERRQQKKKMHELVRQARAAQREASEKLLSNLQKPAA